MRLIYVLLICFLAGMLIAWGSVNFMSGNQSSVKSWLGGVVNSSATTADGAPKLEFAWPAVFSTMDGLLTVAITLFAPLITPLKSLLVSRWLGSNRL